MTVLGDSKGGQRALDDLGTKAGKAETSLSRVGDKFKTVGSRMASIGSKMSLAVTGPLALVGKTAFDAASDLNESLSKSNTIFGESGAAIEKWASGAAKAFGQSKQQALDAAGGFGNMFTQLGIGQQEAAGMSRTMVELASDFASFHNADVTEVLNAQAAAFRGEYDAVQRFVPTINAAAVEQKALEMGLAASTKELTAQDKALATQTLLLDGAGAAMGDFARTADGAANKQRIVKAQFEDTAASLGNSLMPIGQKVLGVLAALAEKFNGLSPAVQRVILVIAGLLAVVGPLMTVFGGLAAAIGFLLSPIGLVIAGIAALVAGVIYAYTHFEGFRNVVQAVVDFLTGIVLPAIGAFVSLIVEQFGALVGWVQQHWGQIQEAIGHVVAVVQAIVEAGVAFITALWSAFGDEIVNIARIVWDQIRNVVETVVAIITNVIQVGLALINGDWGRAWDGIKGILSAAWEFIRETIVNAFRLLGQYIEGGLSAIVGVVGELPARILGALGNLGSLLVSAGADLIWGMISGIAGMAGRLAQKAIDVARSAVRAVKGFLGIGSPSKLFEGFGINVGEGFIRGLDKSEGGVAQAGSSLAAASVPTLGLADLALSNTRPPAVPQGNAGGVTVIVNIAGNVTSEHDLIEAVHAGLRQRQRRVASLALT